MVCDRKLVYKTIDDMYGGANEEGLDPKQIFNDEVTTTLRDRIVAHQGSLGLDVPYRIWLLIGFNMWLGHVLDNFGASGRIWLPDAS